MVTSAYLLFSRVRVALRSPTRSSWGPTAEAWNGSNGPHRARCATTPNRGRVGYSAWAWRWCLYCRSSGCS